MGSPSWSILHRRILPRNLPFKAKASASACPHFAAVGYAAEPAGLYLRMLIFQGEISVSGGMEDQTPHFPRQPERTETALHHIPDCPVGIRYTEYRNLVLTDSEEYQFMCGSRNGCAYTIKVSRTKCDDWKMAVGDFISFNEANAKNIILVLTELEHKAVNVYYEGHRYNELTHWKRL